MNILQIAQGLRACRGAIDWLKCNQHLTIEQLYSQCPRGDWLLWFCGRMGINHKLLILAACDCVDLVKHLLPNRAPKNTTYIIRSYFSEKATIEELHTAYIAVADAIWSVGTVNYAVEAVGCVVEAAFMSSTATRTSAHTVNSAPYAYAIDCVIYAAHTAGVRVEIQQKCADIVRNTVPFDVFYEAVKKYAEKHE